MPIQPIQPDHHLLPLRLEQIHLASWCPTPEPTVPPTQVHLFIDVLIQDGPADPATIKLTFVTRFKSAQALDRFIEALLIHREHVWGAWTRDTTIAEDLDYEAP